MVITDLKMPKIDGIEFLKSVKDQRPETIVILITAYASGETAINAMKEGAYDYVEKGRSLDELKKVVRAALMNKGLISDDPAEQKCTGATESNHAFCGMIGTSREMLKIFNTIKKVSDTPANILILGESGTGKELVARAIHENSSRSKMPFVAINSGGIPENLLESELFGYMKGSFTGAYTDRQGILKWPAAERFFSMKSENYRRLCRSNCCGWFRKRHSVASAVRKTLKWMCALFPRPIKIFRKG